MTNKHETQQEVQREAQLKVAENATKVSATTHNDKECTLFDNTCTLTQQTMNELLAELVKDKLFGINALSASDGIIYLDKPKLSHIQIKDDLYRLYLYRYHAIIESF